MNTDMTAYLADAVFDGTRLHAGHALVVAGGRVQALAGPGAIPDEARLVQLGGGVVAPGFVDLQVNGGGGVMFNADPSVATLRIIAGAHARLGTTALLPTLITDRPDRTRAAIAAAIAATDPEGDQRVPGIAGLHLEGPHLSLARKGAHDPALIRPMQEDDLAMLVEAAHRLPVLMVTLAAESVRPDQVRALAGAGALVSIGHSDADFEACMELAAAGARGVTHLFNAMSQLQGRAPGLVGAALQSGELSAGLIADGIHVHPDSIAVALRAKRGPGGIYLVTDAMATAGTDLDGFDIHGRRVNRRDGRLTLSDGTLAGADLDLAQALRVMVNRVGLSRSEALAMATARPAALAGLDGEVGALLPGRRADFIHLDDALQLRATWRGGDRIAA